MMDPTISLMLLLKNSWSITGSGLSTGSITFTTNWYNENLKIPQITINYSDSVKTIKEIGPNPVYLNGELYQVNVWFRPQTESGTSYGFAKNAMYLMRSEIENIIRSSSMIYDGEKEFFVSIKGWRNLNEIDKRPILFRTAININLDGYS